MIGLNDQLSLELFCRHAFGKSYPKTEYEDISSRAVRCAKGLPLALKVIGSNLRTRKSLKAWEDALKYYERIPRKEIQDVLKVSYDVLEPYAQSVFLDIACFFKGESVEYVKEILEEFGAASNIEELVNKSLLNVDNGYLSMHDVIQDMGREIVRQEAPDNPAKRSRLWFHQDVIDVLSSNDSGHDAIQGIMFDPPADRYPYWHNAFEKMHQLRILIVRYNKSIKTMPDVSKVENLRELRLDRCVNLTTVHESIGFLKHLVHLSALGCYKLKNFPQRMFLPSLEVFELYWCEKLEHFPDIVNEMNKPLKIHMIGTSIKKLPNSVANLIGLVSIDMQHSKKLEYLPSSLFRLPNVVAFDFRGCSKLGESFRRFLPYSTSEANEHLTSKTVKKERHGLEIVMPKTNVPKWFDYRCKEEFPCLWVRGKFPINVVLSLVFQGVESSYVELHLVINGQYVPCKDHYRFHIRPDHVLVCDLRLLYNDEEWLSIDALLLKHEWNQVQISYAISFPQEETVVSEWGVFVHKQGSDNLEDHVQFMCPDPTRECTLVVTGQKQFYLGSFSNSLVYQVMFLLLPSKSELGPVWIALSELGPVWTLLTVNKHGRRMMCRQ
ncbi:CCP protein [Trifolium pratense]|uniref:CCP protein n=1 Tax=Trifolium pratense TaxID=57577 RepID=A0A2K3PAL5_TRIPR|nr:CCP protein [Trifolium pratense]